MASTLKHLRSSTADKRPAGSGLADGQLAINTASGTPGLFFKDSNGAVVKVGPAHVGAAAPNAVPAGSTGNAKGELWVDNSLTTAGLKYYTGSAFVNLTPSGTESTVGLVELATAAETQTGTDAIRAVTPSGLQSKISDSISTTSSTTIASATAVKTAYDLANAALPKAGGTVSGEILINPSGSLVFEGSSNDSFQTTLAVTDPTADRTITFPNVTGTVVTTGDTGSITSTMIADGTIVNVDVNASAAIDGTKISPNFGSQNTTTTGTSTAASFIPTSSGVPTNGLYLPSANNVAVATNGTGRLFVDSSGRVLVGTSSTSVANAAIFQSNSAGTDVGVVTIASKAASPADGALLGVLDFAASNHVRAARIEVTRDGGTWTSGVSQPSRLVFSTTADGASSPTERLRITSAGLVGIGTSSPGALLDLAGNNTGLTSPLSATNRLRFTDTDTTQTNDQPTGTIEWYTSDTDSPGVHAYISTDMFNSGTGALVVGTGNGGSASERVRIDEIGRVGIGTTSPATTLHVAGNARVGTKNSNSLEFYIGGSWSANDYYSIAWSNQYQTSSEIRGIQTEGPGSSRASALAFLTTSNGNVTSERARIDSSGRLLVGTSSTSATSTAIFQNNSASSGPATILFSTSTATPADGVNLGILRFSASNHVEAAQIVAQRDGGTWTAGSSQPTRLVFSTTADGASSPTERMRIDSTGATTLTHPNSTSSSPHLLLVDTGDGRTASIWNNFGTLSLRGSGTSTTTGIIINHGNSYIEYTGAQHFSGVGTTASAANAFLNSGSSPANQLLRSTSSLRYKTDIEDLDEERSASILNFRPVWYRSTADADRKDWSWYGLIAEEVAAIEPRLVHWTYLDGAYEEIDGKKQLKPDAEMVPDGVQYDRLTVLLLDVVKRQQQAIEALEAAVTALQQS